MPKKGVRKKDQPEVQESDCDIPNQCERQVPLWIVIVDNIPTLSLFILGTILGIMVWWPVGILFAIYCPFSIVYFWARICTYCHHFDTRACPCGYGVLAPRFFKFKGAKNFKTVFKYNIFIMFPVFLFPPLFGAFVVVRDWLEGDGLNVPAFVLLVAVSVIGFVIIPAISKFVGCRGCEIKDKCPWMT